MHSLKIIILVLMGLLVQQAFAQKDYGIDLQWGSISIPEQQPGEISDSDLATCEFKEHYYLILQFDEVPTAAEKAGLSQIGIELLGYIPNYAYVAKVPTIIDWSKIGARAILLMKPEYKLSPALLVGDFPAHAVTAAGIKIQVIPYEGIAPEVLLESLSRSGFPTGKIKKNELALTLESSRLLELAAHPAVMYVEFAEAPPKAEGWTGRTAQRVNILGAGPGIGYDGSGVSIAIADDGSVLHEDFRGRVTDFNTTYGGTHGDMTAGLAVGAGNLNPLGMGMAPGAHLFLYSIQDYPHIENAVQNLQQRNVVITSTSYGEGCGGFYDQSTKVVDEQVFKNPALFHTFSAGNSGEESCGSYGNILAPDGGRFGNITGGRKAAKNVITVGNTAYDDHVLLSSSRGPTQDGRIKPDIMANGQGNLSTEANNGYRYSGGTSAAAPSLAGTSALLYQAYRELNNNQNPSAALIKGAMLNTAEDLGNPGPDYITGFGRVHAGRAAEVIQNQWHTSNSITNNATKTHTITIPQGTQQVRVMLIWHDPEGLPFAGKSLVNDLDLSLNSPFGETFRPWVLSKTAHRDSLNKPAYRGIDRVNNVEQITIDDPIAGTYTIHVKGQLVPRGPQEYYIVYYFEKNDLIMAYPNGGEGFVPGETEVIRWDALGNTGLFTLEYSADNGVSWRMIAENIPGNLRHYDWQVPNMAARQVRIRVKRNGKSAISNHPFSILELPDFNFFYVAANTAAIRWRPVPEANVYDVYVLGNKYMDVVGTTNDTTFNVSIAAWQGNWYSVRARHTNGATGRRASAKWYQHRPCEAHLTLKLNFDLYPGETFWEIKDEQGRVWASGGPYVSESPNSRKEIDICLPYGCYTLNMHDTYADGMCCGNGQGSYQLVDDQGKILVSGGRFGNLKVENFCVDGSTTLPPLQVQVSGIKNASCFNAADGSATITASGGTGNYTYSWSNGASTAVANNLPAGVYSVTISDGTSQVSKEITITQPTQINIQLVIQVSACNESSQNAITAKVTGGTPPYAYRWSNNSQTPEISNLNSGNYILTVTDANGCTKVASASLQPAPPLSVSLSAKNISCFGANDGQATATVIGGVQPYRYAWSKGSKDATATGLGTGIHSVTVTDNQGCQATAAVNIVAPAAINLSFSIVHAFGTNNGAVDLAVSGGTPGYLYQWSNGEISEDLSDLGPGTYNVTVTDSKNCTAFSSAKVEFQNPADCSARGQSTRFEWIESIAIGSFSNNSGNNGGYGDFTNLTQNLVAGENYALTLTPGYAAGAFREFWRIWIDFNQDGDFLDNGEEVFAADGFSGSVTGSFQLPTNARAGATKMRVSMRYGSAALPCGNFAYGEVEDYGIVIQASNGFVGSDNGALNMRTIITSEYNKTNSFFTIFPNPASNAATLNYFSRLNETIQITIMEISGKEILQKNMHVNEAWNEIPLYMEQWLPGNYVIKIQNSEEYFVERLVVVK